MHRQETAQARVEAEREQAAAERALLAEAFKQSPALVVIVRGPQHVFEYANERYLQFVGRRDLTGKSVADAIPEMKEQGFIDLLDRVYATGEPFVGTAVPARLRKPSDGSVEERYFDFVYQPLRDAAGAVTGILGHGVDVTERQRAEAAVREAEQRYRAVFEASRDAKIIYTADGTVVDANPAACRMYGLTREQFIGVHAPDAIHPDAVPMFREFVAVAGQGEEFRCETVDRRKDGTTFPIEVQGSSMTYGGRTHLMAVIRDTSERKAAEAALRESERRWELAVNSANDGIWDWNPVTNSLYWSPRCKEMLGYRDDELPITFDVVQSLIHPDDRDRGLDSAVRHLEGRTPHYADEYRLRHKDGSYRWVLARGLAYRNTAGHPERFVGFHTDITDRKLAEAALAESEQRLRLGLRAGNIGTWDWDVPADKVVWSERLYEFHGLRPDEFGGTSEAFAELIHPDDAGRVWSLIQAALNDGKPYEVEFRAVRPSGEVRWLFTTGQVIRDGGGRPVRMLGATIDTTERRQAEAALRESEERFAAFMHNSPTASWITDEEGRIVYVSGTYQRAFALPTTGLIGKVPGELYPPEFAAQYVANIRAVFESGRAVEVEESAPRPDGSVGEFLVYKFPLRGASGRTMVGGVAVDVTERKRAERDREQLLAAERAARAEAERVSRMKDEFLATLSHELRTPLNAILGWSQILARGEHDSADLGEGLRVIERNARAQTQIIGDLLDMSRIISGKVRLDVQRVDLAPVVQAAVDTTRPGADAKGVRLQVVFDPLAGPVSGDPHRLQQVFWNLLSNAVKFTPRDGRVQVLLERVDSHLEVSVIDSGDGIGPEFLPHVFDRFTQADASTTRRHGGLGLGLAIVKQLVELHGGSVRAKSPGKGRGATFTVALPLMVFHAEAGIAPEPRPPAAPIAPPEPSERGDLTGVRVLVVDDEPDARNLVRRLLEDCGAVVVTAGSAGEALDQIRAGRPDVLVSDIGMPVADGYMLIRQIRSMRAEDGGNIPAVALTAYARAEDRVKAVTAGFQHHVAKPVEPAELITMVSSLAPAR